MVARQTMNFLACLVLLSAGCASARQLQQQQQSLDLNGLINQVGQVAQKGLNEVLAQSGAGTQKAANSSRPLAGIGEALQNLGTGNAAGKPAAAGKPGRKAAAPPPSPDNSNLLANTTEITQNVTGSIGSILSNLTSGLGAVGQQQPQQQQQQSKQQEITPPPGIKSSSTAAAMSQLASLMAAALVLVQLLA